MVLFVGDDWAEDHHDVEIQDIAGRRIAKARLPEGVAGIGRLHELIAQAGGGEQFGASANTTAMREVLIGIETDRGPWVNALISAGYRVFAVNPRQVARYRDRHAVSGAKSDAGDAHALADMVRTDAHQLREAAGDSAIAESIKLVARAHQSLIWDRARHVLRLRAALREYFPAALEAFEELSAVDALELLGRAPDPAGAARLSLARISAALRHARRHRVSTRAKQIQDVLRQERLELPDEVVAGYSMIVTTHCAVIATFNAQINALKVQVESLFARHPAAHIYRSQPGLAEILGARVLGEFGDARDRFSGARARKNYAGNSPTTRASGKKRVVTARRVRNNRLAEPLQRQAFSALTSSPGARSYYDRIRGRGAGHNAALRQVSNRLVGILHGCLASGTVYEEAKAWRQIVNTEVVVT